MDFETATVEGVKTKDCGGWVIWPARITEGRITDCTLKGSGAFAGVFLAATTNVLVADNTFKDLHTEDHWSEGAIVLGWDNSGCVIRNNTFKRLEGDVPAITVTGWGNTNTTIQCNDYSKSGLTGYVLDLGGTSGNVVLENLTAAQIRNPGDAIIGPCPDDDNHDDDDDD